MKLLLEGGGGVIFDSVNVAGRPPSLRLQNRFFDSLPAWVHSRLKKYCALREIRKGVSITSADTKVNVFFPITCVVGIAVLHGDSTCAFTRFAGRDSVFGLESLVLTHTLRLEARMLGAGYLLTVPKAKFLGMLGPARDSDRLSLNSAATLTGTAVVNSVCCASHSMAARLARLILEATDSFGVGFGVTLTQSEIGNILGARRESVANILGTWKDAGVIETSRGRMSLMSRDALLAKTCSCYHESRTVESRDFDQWCRLGWDESRARVAEFAA